MARQNYGSSVVKEISILPSLSESECADRGASHISTVVRSGLKLLSPFCCHVIVTSVSRGMLHASIVWYAVYYLLCGVLQNLNSKCKAHMPKHCVQRSHLSTCVLLLRRLHTICVNRARVEIGEGGRGRQGREGRVVTADPFDRLFLFTLLSPQSPPSLLLPLVKYLNKTRETFFYSSG